MGLHHELCPNVGKKVLSQPDDEAEAAKADEEAKVGDAKKPEEQAPVADTVAEENIDCPYPAYATCSLSHVLTASGIRCRPRPERARGLRA